MKSQISYELGLNSQSSQLELSYSYIRNLISNFVIGPIEILSSSCASKHMNLYSFHSFPFLY